MSSIFFETPLEMTDILRKSAKKQLDSYADPWIMMFELLQNALDAVEKNPRDKRVALTIDPGANQITVSDNGCGFPQSMDIFALGKGTKGEVADHAIRGEHGIGMKMVILCSEAFEVWTRTTEGKIWKASFTNGWRFLQNEEQEAFDPDCTDSITPPEYTTSIRVKFRAEKKVYFVRSTSEQSLGIVFLHTKTPIRIRSLTGETDANCLWSTTSGRVVTQGTSIDYSMEYLPRAYTWRLPKMLL